MRISDWSSDVCSSDLAAWAGNVEVLAAPDLLSLLNHFKGSALLPAPRPGEVEATVRVVDLAQVRGQETPTGALEIEAAGGHNLLLAGRSEESGVGYGCISTYKRRGRRKNKKKKEQIEK